MPSHARPRELASGARRTRGLGRRMWQSRYGLAPCAVFLTGVSVTGWPPDGGSAGHRILGVIGTAGGAVAFSIVFFLLLTPVYLRAESLRQSQVAPRPRWQYLMLAAGWMAVAGGLIVASRVLGPSAAHPGWPARACAGYGAWAAVFGLGMLGRAACWGRVRNLFWWHRPLWNPAPRQPG
jgi:hypothetical protein